MPSPFPGMNPYLEQASIWNDFHGSFLYGLRDILAPQVRPQYVTKVDEHLFIHELPEGTRSPVGHGDVAVKRPPFAVTGTSNGGPALVAPAHVRIPVIDVERLPFLEVRDRETWEVVTVIELLSPCNRYAGTDREQFLGKRWQLLGSSVHYIEIDLLRGGPRMPLEGLPPCDYYAVVSRAESRPEAEIWPLGLRDPLPPIPIPLRAGSPDASVDLQQVLHRAYDSAGYEDYMYRGEPQPRLRPEDAAWARQLIPATS